MDVNGTRHRLLLGQDDWAACESPGTLTWSYNQARESVGLETLVFTFPQPQGDRALTLADRRGAARDSYGHWYWIGADRQSIRVRWSEALAAAHYWSAADPRACLNTPAGRFAPKEEQAPADEQLAGLAVTSGHYLVVGSPERESLLIFDLLSGGAAPLRIALSTFAGATPFVFEGERF
ncbi:MAG TPA: hypothetical protein VF897_21130, partial [Roseiflexaceae bacterium]